jgi:nucleoside-diphosphate-sugar epimerase
MKIFITGSNGFIGSHVVKLALDSGHEVVGLRRSTKTPAVKLLKQPKWVEGSLEDDLRPMLKGCDAVIHLAAYGVNPAYNSWQEAFRWNVDATINILEQAKSVGVRRFVLAGSCSEYGKAAERYQFIPCDAPLEPVGPYAASKAAATLAATAFARENDIELAVLRLFHIYGEGESEERFWPSLKKAALAGDDFSMTFGAQIRDFTPVALAAERLLYSAIEQDVVKGRPEIQNLGQGRPMSLAAFAEAQWKKFSATGKLKKGALPYRDNEVMRYVPQV